MEVRHIDTGIKVNICFEMSGAYLQMATLMQDYAPLKMMAEEKVCYIVTFVVKLSAIYLTVSITALSGALNFGYQAKMFSRKFSL